MTLLSKSQMQVFKAVILLNKSTIGKIAQQTGMHRQSVKIILDLLNKKGFIQMYKDANKLLYSATPLQKIKKQYLSQLNEMKKHIPELKADYEETKDTQIINTVSGKLGLRSVLMDEIIKGKEICSFNLSPIRKDFQEEYKANDKRRIETKIHLKVLSHFPMKEIPLSKIKYTKKSSKIDMFIYANKIAIIYNNVKPRIFTIKINEITTLFGDLFNSNWERGK